MFSFLRYPLRYAQICTLCLLCHLSVMLIRITNMSMARNEEPEHRETPKLILIWSQENQEFAFNQQTIQRFAVLNCTYTTCWDMKNFVDNITHIDAIVLEWMTSKMLHPKPRVLQKYTVDSIDSSEFQCPNYFNGLLNGNIAENSDTPYENEENIEPRNSVHFSDATGSWWERFLIFTNETNVNLVLQLTSNRAWYKLLGDQLDKVRKCSDMGLKTLIVDNVQFMSFCDSVFIITS